MTKIIVTELAKQDIRSTLTYLNEVAGIAVAIGYAEKFKSIYKNLALFPENGTARPELGSYTRIKVAYPYLMVYDYDGSTLTILRILHGKQNVTPTILMR